MSIKIKNPNVSVANKVFLEGINTIIDLFEKLEKKNGKDHSKIENRLSSLNLA